ncbi:MAG: MerR family transcriptional regulator, partial [Allosphingosinicella sp.]
MIGGLTIARLAAAAEVGVETVRYYQRRGLLDVPPRLGTIRRYGLDDLRRLRFIRRAQAAGFTLEEISELLALDATDDRARVREMATGRIAA